MGLLGGLIEKFDADVSARQALDLAEDHRLARHVGQNLARQPAGCNPGLEDGEIQARLALCCPAKSWG